MRFLQRSPDLVAEAGSAREVADALAGDGFSLVVLGARLPDLPLVETIQEIRASPSRRVSILAMIAASEPEGAEGLVLGAGANAALRRPLDRFVLESWVSKLVDVPSRVRARIPVHVQVVGSRHGTEGEHFYGLSRNLSVHGMLLASPVRIEAEDLDLEIDLPESEGRVRVLGRIAREAPEVGWPYVGYGIEFLFLPESAQRVIDRLVGARPRTSRRAACGRREPSTRRCARATGSTSSATRRAPRVGFLVEIRRGSREGWRPGRASPFYVIEERSPAAALEKARAFVHRHG